MTKETVQKLQSSEKLEYNDFYENVLGEASRMKMTIEKQLTELTEFLTSKVERHGTWQEGKEQPKTVVIPPDLAAEVERIIDKYPDWIRYTGWKTLEKYVVGVVWNALEANEDFAQSSMLKEYLAEEGEARD